MYFRFLIYVYLKINIIHPDCIAMKFKVLIVSPHSDWANEAIINLDKFFEGEIAETGKDAQLKIYKTSYNYVFVDLDTVSNTGLEVIRYIRSGFPTIKVFAIMSDKTPEDLGIDENALKKLGVASVLRDFAAKKINEPIAGLGAIKKWQDIQPKENVASESSEEAEILDSKFTRLKIDEMFNDEVAIFDLYIRISQNRYIKVLHEGEISSSEQMRKYSAGGTQYLYFLSDDRADYIGYQNELTKKDLAKGNINEGKILKNLKSVTEKYIEEVQVKGIQPQLIEEGKLICQNMFDFTQKDKSLKKVLGSLEDFNPALFSHSFLVCFFCTVIAKNLEWVGTKTLESLALGGLFHDIGLVQLPQEISNKKEEELNPEELALFRQHPVMGTKALDGIPSITPSIKQIVLQHHEASNGAGFPHGLTATKIFPLAKILGLADSFSGYIVDRECSPLDGIKDFLGERDNLARYDSELVKSLVKGFISDKKTAG